MDGEDLQEMDREKVIAPPGLGWRTITPKKKNVELMEVNTVMTEKEDDLWSIVDSGASDNVISEWVQYAKRGPVLCGERKHDDKKG